MRLTTIRYSRKTYALWILGLYGIFFILTILGSITENVWISICFSIWPLILILFTFNATVNRLHDLGQTGWLALILFAPVVNVIAVIYMMFKEGEQVENKYGPVPS